ncbi:Rv3654c family TadE-like protein [Gordonia soli]|uniref:Putative Flp pilus-assembly TadG-like N-terminal domain-containing protein n=1 Tax=Gordonia soli NBRC 108243 TaxID=1223545 RepID=M0QG94_9ACTN|nr:Rv3654c family TadE-like protein [Gordonia soli]GAC67603.1 hypothetical protein GS4_08_01880 [Gordonia soli NBRC 108243]
MADERGFATVTAALVIAGLMTLIVLMVYVGAAVLARHRAQSAADLAALAAAIEHVVAERGPCEAAQSIADEQRADARVVRCAASGEDMVVRVEIPVRLGRLGLRSATADARAGPVG